MSLRICAYKPCGRPFEARRSTKRFCSDECRRAYQNMDRKERKRIAREAKEAAQRPMIDPWTRNDLEEPETLWGNALVDPLSIGGHERE